MAVNERQRQVGNEYVNDARHADGDVTDGPMTKQLRQYGKGGLVVGLVFGGFLEVSEGVHSFVDLAARARATKIHKYASKDQKPEALLALCRRRIISLTSARSWAKLMTERLTFFFPGSTPP